MKLICNRVLMLVLLLGAAFSTAGQQSKPRARADGQNTNYKTAYQFEPEPRQVLSQNGIAASRDPKLSISPSGAVSILAVYGDHHRSQLGLVESHDGGDSFSQPLQVSEKEASVSSHGENSPTFASAWPYIYTLWEQTLPEGESEIMFARTNEMKKTTEKAFRVTDKTRSSPNIFPFMSAAPNGYLYVAWLDGRDGSGNPEGTFSIYLGRSTDQGATFGKNVRVSTAVCPCCRPTIAFGSKGEIFVAFRKVFDGDVRDIVVATSLDKGETFGPAVRVAVDGWKISGCPHTGPAIARRENRLFVAWYSEGAKGDAGIRLSWSDDGSKTFTSAVIASGDVLDPNHPSLSVSEDGRVLMTFQGRDPLMRGGWGPARPFLLEINNAGEPSSPVLVYGGEKSISYPTVAAGGAGRVFVAWTESGERGTQVHLIRGRRIGM